MTHDRDDSTDRLEAALRARPALDAALWERLRSGFAARAAGEGVVDVAFERHDSPLGPILVGATDHGLVRIGLPTEREDEVLDELARRVSPRVLSAPRASVTQARRQLEEYFDRRRTAFEVPLDWQLARGFRRAVLDATARIPYGRTSSYKEVATQAGSPRAARAAGTALACNPLPIVVPCHRVLRSGGQIGDYRGGPQTKARLLELESAGRAPTSLSRDTERTR